MSINIYADLSLNAWASYTGGSASGRGRCAGPNETRTLASESVTRSTAPPSRKAGHPGCWSGHPARVTARRTLSWSPRATRPPGGTSHLPPSLRRSTASGGWFLNLLVVPKVAQLSHPYTSSIRGRGSPPRGSGTKLQSRTQLHQASAWRVAPTAPRAGTVRGSCATCASSALGPRAARAADIRAGSARGSRTAGAGSCRALPCRRRTGWRGGWGGWGRIRAPNIGVDVVDGQGVVVVGVVRRHLLDAGGDAPHCLGLRLWGLPAPLPSPFALPLPCRAWAPSSLPAEAHLAPPLLASGSLPCPRPLAPVRPLPPAQLPVSGVPPSAPHALAFSVRLPFPAAAFACVLPAPLPVSLAVYCVRPSAARALAFPVRLPSPAAACACALPVPLSPSAAASALAVALTPPPFAAARAFAHPWCLPSSSAACHLPMVALRPSRCTSVACTSPRMITVPSCLDQASLQLRQRDVHRRALGRRSADGPWPPLGGGSLWRVRLGGITWVWLRLVWARYLAPSLPSAAAAAVPGGWPGEAPWARTGLVPRAGGVPGAAAWLAGAAVAAPCSLSGGVSGAPPGGGAAGATA